MKYRCLTKDDRIKIEVLLKAGVKVAKIAEELGFHYSSIYREIKKGLYSHRNSDYTTEMKYSSDLGQQTHEYNVQSRSKGLKVGKDLKFIQFLEDLIANKGYSPEAALAEARKVKDRFSVMICTTTCYAYIDKGVFLNLTNKNLPVKGKKRIRKTVIRGKTICRGISITKRPLEVNNRENFGHWEMDTVKGSRGNTKANLLVLTERKTLSEIVMKIPNGCAYSVVNALDCLEKKWGKLFPEIFKTITVDNGVEFADFENMEKSIFNKDKKRTSIFYCHPYSSWERGSNENQNKLIRRHIPKGYDFDDKPHEEIHKIQDWINNYPRRKFNYKSSNELFEFELSKILKIS